MDTPKKKNQSLAKRRKHKGNTTTLLKWRLKNKSNSTNNDTVTVNDIVDDRLLTENISNPIEDDRIYYDGSPSLITKDFIVDGRRIVDIQFIFETISKIKHEPFGCRFSDLSLIKECQSGFYSQFIFKCKMCNKTEIVSSECPKNPLPINFGCIYYKYWLKYLNTWYKFEPIARHDFEKLYSCCVKLGGLFVDFDLPFLAASPDGLVGDDSIIEIKCPFSIKDITLQDAYEQNKLTYMNMELGKLILKKTHSYYYQVQGQLHITKRQYCYFIVWTPKDICVDKISRDDEFWKNKMELPLSEIYLDHMLPEIISPKLNI